MKLNLKLAEGGSGISASEPVVKDHEYFPEFTFREAGEPEFPDEGTMTIRYKKVRSSVDKKADKPYSCTIEVHEIVSAEGEANDEAPSKKYDDAGESLDKHMAEKMGKY